MGVRELFNSRWYSIGDQARNLKTEDGE